MRALWRGLGVLLASAAFVTVVIDATRSIADSAVRLTSLGAVWQGVDPGSLRAAAAALAGVPGAAPALLSLPLAAGLAGLAAVSLWLGRRPRSRIGYASR